jgi:predicted anti-sigma-YlaC factor YlaD
MRQEMVVLTEHTCLDIDGIENYLLQHLEEPEVAGVEERLLICESCREVYSQVERYVCAMRRVVSTTLDQLAQLPARHKTAAN